MLFFDRKLASETPWTKEVCIDDLRTNKIYRQRDAPHNPSVPSTKLGTGEARR
jgi:hypothetical protein